MVNFDVVLRWFDYLRYNPDNAYRFLESFWPSQLESKKWLLQHVTERDQVICIFGGWYGILAHFIAEQHPNATIVNTDVDPTCAEVFYRANINTHITHETWDMADGIPNYLEPDLVINTSSEHVTQEVYDAWWNSIPPGTKYIVQGNNLVSSEHVRLADNLDTFLKINRIEKPQYAGMLNCDNFYRFMAVGVK